LPLCSFGARRWTEPGEKAILWGDSNAQHLAPLLEPVAAREGTSVLLYDECALATADGETTKLDYAEKWNVLCRENRRELFPMIEANPDIKTIIIAGSWVYMVNHVVGGGERAAITDKATLFELSIEDMAKRVLGLGRRLVIVATIPQYLRDPTSCNLLNVGLLRRQCKDSERFLSRADAIARASATLAIFKRVAAKYPSVQLIVPSDGLCETERCITTINGESLYRDGVHFRRNLRDDTKDELARLIGLDRIFAK
jgi:SGNH domain-containing protein